MNSTEQKIADLQEQVRKLQANFNDLSTQFYKNNFTSSQTFNKSCVFTTRLQVPHYTTAPSVCEVGDLIEIGGVLYICTVANTTFTVVGTQT